jgi:hypothetical protein
MLGVAIGKRSYARKDLSARRLQTWRVTGFEQGQQPSPTDRALRLCKGVLAGDPVIGAIRFTSVRQRSTAISIGSHTSTSVFSAAATELCVGWR